MPDIDNDDALERRVMQMLGEEADEAPAAANTEGATEPVAVEGDTRPSNADAPEQPVREPAAREEPRQPAAAGDRVAVRDDGRGNLIDGAGNIVARAGADRRRFQELQTTRAELDRVSAEVEAYRTASQQYSQLGITPQEAASAYAFIAHMKKDPVAAAQKLLADLKAAGYDIGVGGSGVDTAAIRSIVQDAIAPFAQDRQMQVEAEEQRAAVTSGVQDFFAAEPRYDAHLPELQGILAEMDPAFVQSNPVAALREAGYELRDRLAEAGLKFGVPTRPNAAPKTGAPTQSRTAPSNARTPSRPVNVPTAPVEVRPNGRSSVDDINRPVKSIVADVLREHGMQV